jgi:UDP-N-acetylmuramoyl-L-alanyl-D-glutamate--2,6-diaminopimelate ligase
MRLVDVLAPLDLNDSIHDIEVTRVEIDSRLCEAGTLFFAMPGTLTDGALYAPIAVASGAVAVVATHEVEGLGVPVIVVTADSIHEICTAASVAIVGEAQRDTAMVAITGTNAKTSVAVMVAELAQAIGWNGASIGTLSHVRTTPAAPELLRTIQELTSHFASTTRSVIALEVSSHALDQKRIEGLQFQVAAFTNLSHDHLDYHHDMESYFRAKSLLFRASMSDRAVIWTDDPYGERLTKEIQIPFVSVTRRDATAVRLTLESTVFQWRGHEVVTGLVGSYNVDNLLIALSILSSLGADEGVLAKAAVTLNAVPGRFSVIQNRGISAVVDYAHTPEGLRRLLLDIHEINPGGRVITVFGCGGDRDQAKRAPMGQVATELSDQVIVTSDNPRSEDPNAIINEIVANVNGATNWQRQVNRREAIAAAIALAGEGDVVVVAGKGHERVQIIGDQEFEFDDRAVVRELMKRN